MAEEHVRGRMPLESNPGNRNPAIPPVFDTTGKEDYRRVTPENPLPTKDKDLDERLTAIENKLDSVIENGSLNTQLTGSIVEKVTLLESTSINSTSVLRTDKLDLTRFRKVMVYIRSTLDQELTVRTFLDGSFVRYLEDGEWKDTYNGVKLPIYMFQRFYSLNDIVPPLNQVNKDLQLHLLCSEAPTEGSVEVRVLGVVR